MPGAQPRRDWRRIHRADRTVEARRQNDCREPVATPAATIFDGPLRRNKRRSRLRTRREARRRFKQIDQAVDRGALGAGIGENRDSDTLGRSEAHTSELQSLMRNSYAVFCLKTTKTKLIYIKR